MKTAEKIIPSTKERSPVDLLLPVVLGALLAFLFISSVPLESNPQLEDFALGKETVSLFAKVDSYPIHCRYPEDGAACIDGVHYRDVKKLALWLGNSQVHAVNQLKEGEENAPPVLFRLLEKHGMDLVVFSQPNANLQEHYVLFEYLIQKMRVNALILPLVFDDMRETGLRADIVRALDDLNVVEELRQTETGRQLIEASGVNDIDNDMAALVDTVQKWSETALNDWLASHSVMWRERPGLRGTLLTSLYKLRNNVFGITPSTKRKIIPGRYEMNRKALEQLLERAAATGIKVLPYIVPLRSDVEIPYIISEYEAYKADMHLLAGSFDLPILNLEEIVPGKYWGRKASTTGGGVELDFMHFQATGHRLLANALYEYGIEYLGLTANK